MYKIDDNIALNDLIQVLEDNPEANLIGNKLKILSGDYADTSFIINDEYLEVIKYELDEELKFIIVDDLVKLEKLKEHLNKYEHIAYDVESTGLNVRKDKIIGYGLSGKEGLGFYVPIYEYNDKTDNLDKLNLPFDPVEPLKLVNNILTWNGSYDIQITSNDLGIDLTDKLHSEVMLMKHTVQEDGPFKLKGTGIELQAEIGLDVEKDANAEQIELHENIKAKGGVLTKAKFELYKGDLDLIAKYCAKDCDLTLRLFNYYEKELAGEELLDFFYEEEVMPLYKKVTIPMEAVGVRLDLDLINKVDSEIVKDIAIYKEKVLKGLQSEDNFMAWAYDVASAKYPPKKGGLFGQKVAEYYDLPLAKSKSGKYSLAAKGLEKIKDTHRDAYLFLTGNAPLDVEVENEISLSILKDKTDGEIISINSKQQLSKLCFDYFLIEPQGKRGKSGFYSFTEATTDYIAEEYEYQWAKDLQIYNKLAIKIKPTYIDRFLDSNEDGFFYFSYKQHGTISGRYSSDAQQIPRPMEEGEAPPIIVKYVNYLRKFFIAREGYVFVDADYESLEPHVFSDVSNEDSIRDIFRKGHDFYSTIAIATEDIEGVSADKKADNYLGKIDKPRRQAAKAYSLGIPYGLGGYALSKSLDVSKERGAELVDKYLSAYPNLHQWMKDSERMAKTLGYVRTKSGRIRHLPKVKELYQKHGDKLLNFKYRNKLISQLKGRMGKEEATKYVNMMYLDYKTGINNAKNVQIQGLAGSIVNRALIKIMETLEHVKPIAQIHDQVIVEIPVDKSEEYVKIIQDIMENTTKLSVDLKAPPELAYNWNEGH